MSNVYFPEIGRFFFFLVENLMFLPKDGIYWVFYFQLILWHSKGTDFFLSDYVHFMEKKIADCFREALTLWHGFIPLDISTNAFLLCFSFFIA